MTENGKRGPAARSPRCGLLICTWHRIRIDFALSLFVYMGRPIYMAAQEGHMEIVRALIEAGADVNLVAQDGCTPIDIAKRKGHAAIVRALRARCRKEAWIS